VSPITKTRTARSDEWATPKWLFDHFDAEFHFTLDACAQPWNAKCARFFTPEDDGLKRDWYGETVWVNPPYSDPGPWMEKASMEGNATYRPSVVVCLVPNAPDTHWWRNHVEGKAAEIRLLTRSLLPTGRVHFEKEDGWSGRAGFSSALVIYRKAA
jgi:phage N-6-adenine-methyltransferase